MASELENEDGFSSTGLIELTNLPQEADEDYIRLLFDDEETCGKSVQIKHVFLDTAKQSAVIELKNPDDADAIANKHSFEMEGKTFEAKRFELSTVEVIGPTDIVSDKNKNTLNLHFKNARRSGGGRILELEIIQPGKAMIKYASEEIAKKVWKKHSFLNAELEATVYHPKRYKSNTLLISNLPDSVDTNYLEYFFEDEELFGTSIQVTVDFNKDEYFAYVHFASIADLELVLEHLPLMMDDYQVDTKWCSREEEMKAASQSSTVVLKGHSSIINERNEHVIKQYFKQSFKTKGDVTINFTNEAGTANVTFDSEEDARQVSSHAKHVVQNQQVDIRLLKEKDQKKEDEHFEQYEKIESVPKTSAEIKLNKIKVQGIPKSVDEYFLELVFEKEADSDVEKVTILPDKSSAIIEFKDPNAVDLLVERKTLKIKDQSVTINKYSQEEEDISCTIRVTGKQMTKHCVETLLMYFTNTRRSGGGSVIQYFHDENAAYFKFENKNDALRVLKTNHNSQGITVKLFEDKMPTDDDTNNDIQETILEVTLSNTATLKVKGVHCSSTQETLELYFENTKRSGGSKIVEIMDDAEDNSTKYITFENHDVAKTVSDKKHTIDGYELEVSLYVHPPSDEKKILVRGISENTTKDSLMNFLEAKSNTKPVSVSYHAELPDVALVTMEHKPDFGKLQKACSESRLEGEYIKLSKVSYSNCIWVGNLAPEVTKETVQYYFESKKGGEGAVEKVTMIPEDQACLVYFEDYKVIDFIVEKKHQLSEQQLSVKRYALCLRCPEDDGRERKMKLPDPIEYSITDSYKLQFLVKSDYRQYVENELKKNHVQVIWPSDKKSVICLQCTLNNHNKGSTQLIRNWKKNSMEVFESLLKSIAEIDVHVVQNVWGKAEALTFSNPEKVCVYHLPEKGIFKIVGKTDDASSVHQKIEEAISDLAKDLSKVNDEVTAFKTPLDLMLLQRIQFLEAIRSKYPDLKADIKLEEGKIILEGSQSSVRNLKLEIYEKCNQFLSFNCGKVSDISQELYGCPETINIIKAKLQKEGILAVWTIDAGEIIVCCSEGKFQQQCSLVIQETVKENALNIKELEIPNLKSTVWQNEVEDIQRSYPGKASVTVSADCSEIIVCATDDIINVVTDQIRMYIKSNSIVVKTVNCESDILCLLGRHHQKELKAVSKGLEKEYIQVHIDEAMQHVVVKGLEQGLKQTVIKTNELIKKVKVRDYTLTKPGIRDYLNSLRGKDNLEQIETIQPCKIKIIGQKDSSMVTDIIASYKSGSINIIASVCDITEKSVDMILNPSDENLQLLGGLGRAIASKGGQSIKDDCMKQGRLSDMEIFITSGGNLKTRFVAHFKSDEWQGGRNREKENLIQIVLMCLQKANHCGFNSVAIPAIGCGVNGYPIEIATAAIVDGVRRFYLEIQDSCIETVYLCDVDINKVQGFMKAMCSFYGRKNVHIPSEETFTTTKAANVPVQTAGAKPRTTKRGKTKPSVPFIPPSSQSAQTSSQRKKTSVKLIKGELAKEMVDVIVNTTSADLDLKNGAVSVSLLKAAGQSLQDELKANYPNGLVGDKVAVSTGHQLSCGHVLHTAIEQFDKNNPDNSKKLLKETIIRCLDETMKLQHTKISFPAIGTGNLAFPREIVAETMYSTVAEYCRKHSHSTIEEVHFVVYPGDLETVKAFEREHAQLSTDSTFPQDWIDIAGPDDGSSSVYMIGTLGVCPTVGDLLEEDVDCIVNDTGEHIDFQKGKFSKQLLSKGGKQLEEEFESIQKDMQTKGIGFTSAPKLPCKHIIQVATSPKHVSEPVEKCLKMAERMKVKSISFPELCTESLKRDPTEIAKEMVKGIKNFVKTKPQYLKGVRIVVSQANSAELNIYQTVLEKASDANASKGWYKAFLNFFGFGGSSADSPDDSEETVPQATTEKSASETNSVTFKIYALKESVIDQVKQKINACLEGETMTKTFDDEEIGLLDENQVLELESMIKQRRVQVEIDKDKSTITITGLKDNIHETSDIVHRFLKDVSESSLMVHVVQWFSIIVDEEGEELEPYMKNVNIRIERAYQKKEKSYSFWPNEENQRYIIDFEKMEEYPENDPTATARIIRRDYVQSGFTCDDPHNWEDMKGGKIRVVEVNKQSSEYKDIEKKFQESSLPNDCSVEKIERVQNRTLWVQYQSKKKEMDDVNVGQTNERYLWHGTKDVTVDSVNVHGFNRSYCGKNATLYGDGVYFAIKASYSCQDIYSKPDANGIKRMYYCRVLTGDFTLGKKGDRFPPPNPTRGKHCLYNSLVNDMDESKRQMYVIFHDAQAYPEYLLYFKM